MSAPDPYIILGVSKQASAEEIKSAYRRLAKQYHPDLNPGKPDIEKKFKDINAAYDLLSDAQKKERFDRGEIDASGQEQGFHYQKGHRTYQPFGQGGSAEYSLEDIFEEFMGKRSKGRQGSTLTQTITLSFLEAALGTRKRLTKPDGKTFDVTIPPGVENQQTLRLKGQGQPSLKGGPTGDLLLNLHISPHTYFKRDGKTILLNVPVTLDEAVLGSKITVPTIHGPLQVSVPKGANTDMQLRLKGKGIHKKNEDEGDQYITLKVMLPSSSAELETFLKSWSAKHHYEVREHFKKF